MVERHIDIVKAIGSIPIPRITILLREVTGKVVPVDYEKLRREIEPRVDWLKNQRKYVEAFLFLNAVLEAELIELIELYEERSASMVKNYGLKLNLRNHRESKHRRMTLGQLSDYLRIFIGHGALINELNYFIELRNRCIHKLLGESISTLDIEISRNLNRYYRLLYWLIRRQTKLYKSLAKSSERKVKRLGMHAAR